MSNLSKALQKYYSREGKTVVFRNKQSLNQLALAMWKKLGFQQIDASVLSRVLKGERLFTAGQLTTFCQLLNLPNREQDYLFACLQQDYNSKLDLPLEVAHISAGLSQEIISELTANAFHMFYQGSYSALDKKSELVQHLSSMLALSHTTTPVIYESVGLNLYLKGRSLANGALPSQVIGSIYPLYSQLIKLSRQINSQRLYGYAHILLCNGYYLAGGYSNAAAKHKSYSHSIRHGKIALTYLAEDDHESLFALRCMASSASYINDQATTAHVVKRAKQVIPRQPKDNFINSLHLSMSLSRCLAITGAANPFATQELASKYFRRSLANTGVYEVSGIKEEVDTLLLLRTQDTNYIQTKIKEGLNLAQQYNFRRQKKYFNKLLRSL